MNNRLEKLVERAYERMTKLQTKTSMIRHFKLLSAFYEAGRE